MLVSSTFNFKGKGLRTIAVLIAFALVAIVIAVVIGNLYESEPLVRDIDELLESDIDVLYVGDSTLYTFDAEDSDRRTIDEMFASFLGNSTSLGTISHGSYSLSVYHSIADYVAKSKNKPSLMIIPLNMRSFGPQWSARPQWSFYAQRNALDNAHRPLKRLVGRVYSVFGENPQKMANLEDAWLNSQVNFGDEPIGKISDFNYPIDPNDENFLQLKRDKIVYYYLSSVEDENIMLEHMRQVIRTLNDADIAILFYITPLDVEEGAILVNSSYSQILRSNTAKIRSVAKEGNSSLLDLSFSLNSSFFIDEPVPTEHLNSRGRMYVARQLSDGSKQLLLS